MSHPGSWETPAARDHSVEPEAAVPGDPSFKPDGGRPIPKPPIPLDEKDQALLRVLGRYGRMSWVDLAREVDLSPTAAAERVRKLEEAGVIVGYSARLNPRALDLGVLAFVWVGVQTAGAHEALRKWADAHPCIQECHSLAGRRDYTLKLRCRDVEELEQIVRGGLRAIPGVCATETHIVTSTAKETLDLPAS